MVETTRENFSNFKVMNNEAVSDFDIAQTMLEKLIPSEFRKEHKSKYRLSK